MEIICRKCNYPEFINCACGMTRHDCISYAQSHHVESGVSAWLGLTLCLVFDHGKSTLCWCLMYDVRTWLIDTMFGVRW